MCGLTTWVVLEPKISVWPPGLARATNSPPICPEAPGLFSTMKVVLSDLPMASHIKRANASSALPAGPGTTTRTGWLG